MGTPREPKPAKYFVALLSSDTNLLTAVEQDLAAILGDVDVRSEMRPWTLSKFYESEMGPGLQRRFLAFDRLTSPQKLAEVKLRSHEIEARHFAPATSSRRVNLDPGYVDVHKVVLASTKDAGQRIYLQSGIYGEVTLLYNHGEFHGLSYTYPDYLWPESRIFFAQVRTLYLQQLKRVG